MDLIKIGAFIQRKRKENGLTQSQLAERLSVTDRAVSKWENGICLPDADNMLLLCKILGVTVNDLLNGEVIDIVVDKNYETRIVELIKEKQQTDKKFLSLEIFIGFFSVLFLFGVIALAVFLPMPKWLTILLIVVGFIVLLAFGAVCMKIEQKTGYYECACCGHRYVPKYSSVFFAMHLNRTRYMKCPSCGKRSWQKKVLTAPDEDNGEK